MSRNLIAILILFTGSQVNAGLVQLDSVGTKVDVHIIGDGTNTYIDEGTADKYHQSNLEYHYPDSTYSQYGIGSAEVDTLAGTIKNYAESSGASVSSESDLRSLFTVIDDDPNNYNSSVSIHTSVDGIFSGDISGGSIYFQTRLSLCADFDCSNLNHIYGGVSLGLQIEGTDVTYINESPYGNINSPWNPGMVEIGSTGLVIENDYLGSGDTYVSMMIDITFNEVEKAIPSASSGSTFDYGVSFSDYTRGEVWNQLDLFMGAQIEDSGFMDFSHTVESDLEFINATAVPVSGDGLMGSAVSQVPEPSILAIMGLGLAGLGFAHRRRTQAKYPVIQRR